MITEMKKTVVYSTGDKILNIMKEQDMVFQNFLCGAVSGKMY